MRRFFLLLMMLFGNRDGNHTVLTPRNSPDKSLFKIGSLSFQPVALLLKMSGTLDEKSIISETTDICDVALGEIQINMRIKLPR
jgi:hypothetical protein